MRRSFVDSVRHCSGRRRGALLICCIGLALLLGGVARSAGASSSTTAKKNVGRSEGPVGLVAHYWVDKGKRIVFEGCEGACSLNWLWVMDADGQHKRRVAPEPGLASVSPSGRLLARLVDARRRRGRSRLIITTLAGKAVRTFTFRAVGDVERPRWARDESAVAFETQEAASSRIYVADRRKGIRLVAQGPFLYGPAWAPDSRLLAFRRCPEWPGPYWTPRWRGCDLTVVRRDGSHRRVLARHLETDELWHDRAPPPDPWSPNGRWLVFARVVPRAPSDQEIYVTHPDGSGLRRVPGIHGAYGDIRSLVWSPDNKRLAYIAGGIFVIPFQGGPELRVTTKKNQDTLSWVPSKRILYSRRGVIWTVVPGQPPVAVK